MYTRYLTFDALLLSHTLEVTLRETNYREQSTELYLAVPVYRGYRRLNWYITLNNKLLYLGKAAWKHNVTV